MLVVYHVFDGLVFNDNKIDPLLHICLEASPVSDFIHIFHGCPHINFCLMLLIPNHQTTVSRDVITLQEVVAMSPTTPETVPLPLLSGVVDSKEDIAHILSLTPKQFIIHFK